MKKYIVSTIAIAFIVFFGFLIAQNQAVVFASNEFSLDLEEQARDAGVPGTDLKNGMGYLIAQILRISMTIAAFILLINFIWAGFEWITGSDDKSKIEKARQRILQSIIGIIVLASVVALMMMVQGFLRIEVFNFSNNPGGSTGGGAVGSGGGGIIGRPGSGGSGGTGGSGGSSGGGSVPYGKDCTVTGRFENDGGRGNYCTQGSARVICVSPDHPQNLYGYNHYNPCSCIDGAEYQISGYSTWGCTEFTP